MTLTHIKSVCLVQFVVSGTKSTGNIKKISSAWDFYSVFHLNWFQFNFLWPLRNPAIHCPSAIVYHASWFSSFLNSMIWPFNKQNHNETSFCPRLMHRPNSVWRKTLLWANWTCTATTICVGAYFGFVAKYFETSLVFYDMMDAFAEAITIILHRLIFFLRSIG